MSWFLLLFQIQTARNYHVPNIFSDREENQWNNWYDAKNFFSFFFDEKIEFWSDVFLNEKENRQIFHSNFDLL